jgi:hypothetical protein
MDRVRQRIFAGLAALALAGGAVAAVETSGNAATVDCGASCTALAAQEWGTGYVVSVSGGTVTGGQTVTLTAAGLYNAEDFRALDDGTVAALYGAGLVGAAVGKTWPAFGGYEYEYAPGGIYSGYCLGTASTAAAGVAVGLQQCGVSARTLWIPLTIDAIGGFEPIINGSDTEADTPYVLTAGGTAGAGLTTRELDLVAGTFDPAEMWQAQTGVL